MAASEPSARDTIWRMVNAFQDSMAIHVVATLGIADLLRDGPRSVADLASATGSDELALFRLLRALASTGIFAEGPDGRFRQSPLSELLRTDAPGSVRAWAMYVGRPYTWTTWGHFADSVKSGRPVFPDLFGTDLWTYRSTRPEENAIFDAAMTGISAAAAAAVAGGYDFSQLSRLVDVGGGRGELLAAILAANPDLRGVPFDQPHVVADAGELLQEAGVAERCEVVGGSFFEAVPPGADAYLLKSVLHDWDDPEAIAILRRCRAAIPPSGRLLVVERVVRPANEPDGTKLLDLHMLVMLGGRERTAAENAALLDQAGFRPGRVIPTSSPYSIIECAAA